MGCWIAQAELLQRGEKKILAQGLESRERPEREREAEDEGRAAVEQEKTKWEVLPHSERDGRLW